MEILSLEQKRMLVQVGYAACLKGKVGQAMAIFDGLLEFDADYAPAKIGKALAFIVCDKFNDGEVILKKLVADGNSTIKDEVYGMLCLSAALQNQQDIVDEYASNIDSGSEQGQKLLESAHEVLANKQ